MKWRIKGQEKCHRTLLGACLTPRRPKFNAKPTFSFNGGSEGREDTSTNANGRILVIGSVTGHCEHASLKRDVANNGEYRKGILLSWEDRPYETMVLTLNKERRERDEVLSTRVRGDKLIMEWRTGSE